MKTSELMKLITGLPDFKKVAHYKVIKHRHKKGSQQSLDKLERIFNEFGYYIDWVK